MTEDNSYLHEWKLPMTKNGNVPEEGRLWSVPFQAVLCHDMEHLLKQKNGLTTLNEWSVVSHRNQCDTASTEYMATHSFSITQPQARVLKSNTKEQPNKSQGVSIKPCEENHKSRSITSEWTAWLILLKEHYRSEIGNPQPLAQIRLVIIYKCQKRGVWKRVILPGSYKYTSNCYLLSSQLWVDPEPLTWQLVVMAVSREVFSPPLPGTYHAETILYQSPVAEAK